MMQFFYVIPLQVRNGHTTATADSTISRLLSKVKHCRVRLVLWWGTTLVSGVFLVYVRFLGYEGHRYDCIQ